MDIDDFIFSSILPLISGPIIFLTDTLWPVIPSLLGIGIIQGKGGLWGLFSGFIISFTFFRLFISLIVKLGQISSSTVQYAGFFFLLLFGMIMIFPQIAPWKRVENNFTKGAIYTAFLGFIWAFWVGLSKAVFADYYEPKWIGFFEIYFAFLSSLLPGVIIVCMNLILSKIYPSKSIGTIERILGVFTLCLAMLLIFGFIKIKTPREELKPEEPPPVPLHEIFHLKKKFHYQQNMSNYKFESVLLKGE